jgi:hypothetical protein
VETPLEESVPVTCEANTAGARSDAERTAVVMIVMIFLFMGFLVSNY